MAIPLIQAFIHHIDCIFYLYSGFFRAFYSVCIERSINPGIIIIIIAKHHIVKIAAQAINIQHVAALCPTGGRRVLVSSQQLLYKMQLRHVCIVKWRKWLIFPLVVFWYKYFISTCCKYCKVWIEMMYLCHWDKYVNVVRFA